MSRRTATFGTGLVLLALLFWQAIEVPVPYVELGPGPTYNTLGTVEKKQIIQVDGVPTSSSAGELRMVTVSVRDVTLFEAVQGWFSPSAAVVPRELIYPPDKTEQQIDEQNAADFKTSQSAAETAAARALGYPVHVTIREVSAGQASDGLLRAGDVVESVDGEPVTSQGKLTTLIRAKPAGTSRTLGITRDGATQTVQVVTRAADDGNPRIGVTVEEKQPHPFTTKIELDQIGGPSAGMMFALGIIDKVDPTDLTGGIHVAGTGEIDSEGNVGPIGGISQKVVAAKRDGATVFFSPADNCAEAKANVPKGLRLVRVNTLDEALAALKTLREHGDPPAC